MLIKETGRFIQNQRPRVHSRGQKQKQKQKKMMKLTLVTLLALIATATGSALPTPEFSPDGHCEAGEGVACSGSIIGNVNEISYG